MKVLLFVCFCVGLAYAQQSNIVQLAESLGATTLVNLVKAAGLDSVLSGNGKTTIYNMSRDMRFPTMCYVRPAKPQISLRIRAK